MDRYNVLRHVLEDALWRSVVAGGGSPDVYTFGLALVAAALAAFRAPRAAVLPSVNTPLAAA